MNDNGDMTDNHQIRIDKFLWAIRIYKTRNHASEACRKGRILINDNAVKPSRNVSDNDIITVRKPPVTYKYKVIHPIAERISAKYVTEFLEDLTPEGEKEKLFNKRSWPNGYREKGSGRPTKKERRKIDYWTSSLDDT